MLIFFTNFFFLNLRLIGFLKFNSKEQLFTAVLNWDLAKFFLFGLVLLFMHQSFLFMTAVERGNQDALAEGGRVATFR